MTTVAARCYPEPNQLQFSFGQTYYKFGENQCGSLDCSIPTYFMAKGAMDIYKLSLNELGVKKLNGFF